LQLAILSFWLSMMAGHSIQDPVRQQQRTGLICWQVRFFPDPDG
jgi:hypothetical protein